MWVSRDWKDYELLDTSDGEKLERWGKYVFIRPDPQAVWGDKSNNPLWKKADGRYIRSSSGGGQWQFYKKLPEHWTISQGGYCFKCEDMLISGDTLFAVTIGRTDLPGGDYATIMDSLKISAEVVGKQNLKVMPGHAHFSTFNQEKVQNPYLKEAIKCL